MEKVKVALKADRLLGFRLAGSDAGHTPSFDKIAAKIGNKEGAKVPVDPTPTETGSIGEDRLL